MGGGHEAQNYPDDLGEFTLDPDLMDHSTWSMPEQYQNQDPFASHQGYQQYSTPSFPPYGNYGVPQQPQYSANPFSSIYASQVPQSASAQSYGQPSYGINQFHSPAGAPNSFPHPTNSFPFTNSGAEGRTISPAALQRNDHLQVQRSGHRPSEFLQSAPSRSFHTASPQPWNQIGSFRESPSNNQTVSFEQQNPLQPGSVNYAPLTTSASPAPGHVVSEHSRPPSRQVNAAPGSDPLRTTHPDLLSTTAALPAHRLKHAPFVVLGGQPIDLVISGKTDIPKYKARKNRSGKPLVPGLDIPSASDSPLPNAASKPRSRKARPSTTKLKIDHSRPPLLRDGKVRAGSALNSSVEFVASPSLASSSEEKDESSEEDSDESDEEMPVELLNDIRSDKRPDDAADAAAWDAIGIVWADRHRQASREEIIKAIPEFQEYVSALREDLKKVTANLAKAAADKKPEDTRQLKEVRALKRRVIARVFDAASKTGHPHILERLGDSQKLVNTLTSVLIDCTKAEDHAGELPKSVFRLMTRFTTLTEPLLQKVKFDKIGKIFSKKADAEVKAMVTKILNSTPEAKNRVKKAEEDTRKAEVEAKKEAVKLEKLKNGLALQEKLRARKQEEATRSSSAPTSLKRAHDGDGSNGKPTKKVASDASAVISAQKSAGLHGKAASSGARPTNFFANLTRPGPKPQTPTTKTSTGIAVEKKPEIKAAPPQQSSLAAILASIETPRQAPKEPEAPPRPPETPEEKAKRERKESRRHLRVRWKDGAALADIRLFKHEQAEDEGRQDDMLRDAHDDRSEGLRLKQALEVSDALDDDEEAAGEIEYRPYPELVPIDFDTLDPQVQARNFVTRGGNVSFKTPQQHTQKQRESLELMVVYTDPSDIPHSPKEPALKNSDQPQVEKAFGQPQEGWLVQRLQNIWQFGPERSLSMFARRLEENRSQENLPDTSQATDITSYLNPITQASSEQPQRATHFSAFQDSNPQSTRQTITSTPQPTMDPEQLANLISVVESLKGRPYPPVEPPDWMTENGKREWWAGYHRDQPIKNARKEQQADVSKPSQPQLPAALTQSQIYPPQMQAPQMQAPQMQASSMAFPQFPGFSASQSSANATNNATSDFDVNQFNSILAGLNSGQNSTAEVPQQLGWNGQWPANNTYPGYDPQTQNQQYPQQNPWDTGYNADMYRAAYGHMSQENGQQRSWDTSLEDGNDRTRSGKELHEGAKAYKGKRKPCKFWGDGKCAKGQACGYLHD
ncbi:MAG: hypothetical protein M1818_002625 [Claussenomyces sp. TS43310]|nr:MAG: hypothetical protein M1818_002625 [Claussenomyces sp. TS43310]